MKNLKQPIRRALLTLGLATPLVANAHGPQLQITNDGGQIVPREVIGEGPYDTVTPAKSAYVIPVREFDGGWFARPNNTQRPAPIGGPVYYSGPGLAYGSQFGTVDAFAAGEDILLNFTSGLQVWDGAAFVDPGDEQVMSFRGSLGSATAQAITTDSGPFESLLFSSIGEGVEAHATARHQLLAGPGAAAGEPDDGLYLLSLSLSTTQPSVADSDPFYFLLNKNAGGDLSAAIGALGLPASAVQIVPEPAAAGAALLLLTAGLLRRKR